MCLMVLSAAGSHRAGKAGKGRSGGHVVLSCVKEMRADCSLAYRADACQRAVSLLGAVLLQHQAPVLLRGQLRDANCES